MKQEHESSIRVGPAPGGPASTTTRISGSMNYALPRFGLVAVLTLGARFVGAFTAAPRNGGTSGRNRDEGFVGVAVLTLLVVALVPLGSPGPSGGLCGTLSSELSSS